MVFFLIGLLSLVLIGSNKFINWKKENVIFTITLNDSIVADNNLKHAITEIEITEFKTKLNQSPYFKEVIFIDKTQANKIWEENYAEEWDMKHEDLEYVAKEGILPQSFNTKVKSQYVNNKGFREIENYIDNYKGGDIVREYNYQKYYPEDLNSNVQTISMFLFALCILFLFISFALINSAIRLATYSKRLSIKTMRLVGATNFFIQKPYLITSMYQGLYSSIISICMIIGLIEIIQNKFPQLINHLNENDLLQMGIIFLLILIFGVLISCICTFFAVRRYLKLNEKDVI